MENLTLETALEIIYNMAKIKDEYNKAAVNRTVLKTFAINGTTLKPINVMSVGGWNVIPYAPTNTPINSASNNPLNAGSQNSFSWIPNINLIPISPLPPAAAPIFGWHVEKSTLEVGQIYEYRMSQDYCWRDLPALGSYSKEEILKIVDFAVIIKDVTLTEARFSWIKTQFAADFGKEELLALCFFKEERNFRLLLNKTIEEKYGVHCGNCGKYCEHAIFALNFKCWACKNGW